MNPPRWLSNRWIGRMRATWRFGATLTPMFHGVSIAVALAVIFNATFWPNLLALPMSVVLLVMGILLVTCSALYRIGTKWIDIRIDEDETRRRRTPGWER